MTDRLQACRAFSKANPWTAFSEYSHVVVDDCNIEDFWILNALAELTYMMSCLDDTPAGIEKKYYDLLYFYVDLLKLPMPEGWDDET